MIPQHNALQIIRKPRIALLTTGGTIAGTAGSATATHDYSSTQPQPRNPHAHKTIPISPKLGQRKFAV